VVLYAAHGGTDPGVSTNGQNEKEWTLRLAQALQKALAADGFDVVMVRSKDETITEEAGINQLNQSGAGAALILHADRDWTGKMRGPLVIVEPPTGVTATEGQGIQYWGTITPARFRQSMRLAKSLTQAWGVSTQLSNLSDSRALPGEMAIPDGRIWACPHQSLRNLNLPAVVVEPLFLSSSKDVKYFSTDEGMQEFITKTVQGFHLYFQSVP
jgi:N-acetylmuramoyl-L-alanine amidase